jgi:thiol-disulfide isomerase/thioredoxin
MKKKILISILGLLCLFFRASGQDKQSPGGLKPGDRVPDLLIRNITGYSSDTASFRSLGKKLLILDFWATTCGSCIAKMPEELALEQQYKGSLLFLLVDSKNTKDTKARTGRFFASRKAYTKFASVVEDTVLFNLFPHLSEPHYAWIRNDTVVAISGPEEVNQVNIRRVLIGQKVTITDEQVIRYDPQKPMFINSNGGVPERYIYRQILTPYQEGLNGVIYFDRTSTGEIKGYRFVNMSRQSLYREAYQDYNHFDENRTIYRVSHPEEFSADSVSLPWRKRNLFIYEASFPAVSKLTALDYMRNDLDKFFGLAIDTEYQVIKCMVIKKGKRSPKPQVKQSGHIVTLENTNFLSDHPISDLVDYLNESSKIPVLNETGFRGTFRMTTELSDLSIGEILDKLKKEGFAISVESRRITFLVFSEKRKDQ